MLLFVQNFLTFCAYNFVLVLPEYLANIGANRFLIGLFFNLNSLGLVLLVVPLSLLTDSIGRKKLLVVTYLLSIMAYYGMFIFFYDLGLLFLFKALAALGFCASFTIFGAEIFEIVPKDRRVAGIALFGISGLLSNPVATIAGEWVLQKFGVAWIFFSCILFLSVATILSLGYSFHRTQKFGLKSFWVLLKKGNLHELIVITLVFGGAFSVFTTFLAKISAERLGYVQISLFFTAFSAIAITSRLLLARWIDRIRKDYLLALCFLLIGLALLGALFLEPGRQLLLIPMGIFYGLGHSVLFPVLSTLFVQKAGLNERLGLSNLYAAVNTFGNISVALVLGLIGDVLGTASIFGMMAIVAIVTSSFILLEKRKKFMEQSDGYT